MNWPAIVALMLAWGVLLLAVCKPLLPIKLNRRKHGIE